MSLSVLREMLTYCRPHGSREDNEFRQRYLLNLPGAVLDVHKNIHVEIGSGSKVLWSSHTDTVHWRAGRQTIHYDVQTQTLMLSKRAKRAGGSSCLGADDTVGVYLMREMILAGISGYYIFHYGEESGGIGSSALAKTHADFLRRFDFAIALDRANYGDVITHQWGMRTCSETFAHQLANDLNALDNYFNYAPCDGVYTDTAEYAGIISECTNLSVGYFRQHGTSEHVDVGHVFDLLAVLKTLDTSSWQPSRDPSVDDDYNHYGNLWSNGLGVRDADDEYFDPQFHKDAKYSTVKEMMEDGAFRVVATKPSVGHKGYCPHCFIDYVAVRPACPLCHRPLTMLQAPKQQPKYLDPALEEIMDLNDYEVCIYPEDCFCSTCRD